MPLLIIGFANTLRIFSMLQTLSSPEKATSGGVDVGFPIRQADFCPSDPNIVCVSGNGVLKLLKVTEGTFRPMAISLKRDPQNFMCHAWLPEDRLVLATDHGELLLFENFEFRMVLSSSPQDGEPLCCIQPYSKVRCFRPSSQMKLPPLRI